MSAIEVEIVPSLSERTDRIVATLETAAIEVGRELLAAKQDHPGTFMAWVTAELPFGHDKAQRLMSIARFAGELDPEVLSALPKAWPTLFELTKWDAHAVQAAVRAGELGPGSTKSDVRGLAEADLPKFRKLITGSEAVAPVAERKGVPGPKPGSVPAANRVLETDTVARELIRSPRADLSGPIERLLRSWLGDPDE